MSVVVPLCLLSKVICTKGSGVPSVLSTTTPQILLARAMIVMKQSSMSKLHLQKVIKSACKFFFKMQCEVTIFFVKNKAKKLNLMRVQLQFVPNAS